MDDLILFPENKVWQLMQIETISCQTCLLENTIKLF